ncbi:MAG: hypothetical protein OSB43_08050 [Nocardioides sp.]|uniref:hypothetical protein n=1 Tax=Nocardioides sp. TaxID=35761 RepID=UPI002382498E|nr:hypothetical protein [Nocardioides sp.]MDE0776210.1 hypothetical protein [Nocardioides sp.]
MNSTTVNQHDEQIDDTEVAGREQDDFPQACSPVRPAPGSEPTLTRRQHPGEVRPPTS